MIGKFPLDAELDPKGLQPPEFGLRISAACEDLIRSCSAVLANLTPFRGPSADVGTVYEVGFAVALGKVVVGYTESDAPFIKRTSDWLRRLGEPARARIGGDLEDCDGMRLESFGLLDNLMIPGGIQASGGTIIGPGDVEGGREICEAAAAELAQRLRGGDAP